MIKVQTEQKNERAKVKINVMEGTVDDMANELGSIVGAVTKEIYQLTENISAEILKSAIIKICKESIDEALGKEYEENIGKMFHYYASDNLEIIIANKKDGVYVQGRFIVDKEERIVLDLLPVNNLIPISTRNKLDYLIKNRDLVTEKVMKVYKEKYPQLFMSKSNSMKALVKGDIGLDKFLNIWGL